MSVLPMESYESFAGDRSDHRYAPHCVNLLVLRDRSRCLAKAYTGSEAWPQALLDDIERMIRHSVVGVTQVSFQEDTVKFSTSAALAGYGYGFRIHPSWMRK